MSHIIGNPLPNIPWEERPKNCNAPIWRYSQNPIIDRNPINNVTRVFNSAMVPFKGKFYGVFRGETNNGIPFLYVGHSNDGIHIQFEQEPIQFVDESGNKVELEYAYDPRVIPIEDKFFVCWCNGYHGPTIGIATTTDFEHFVMLEHPFLPYNRNGVLFPRKINGEYVMLSRPSDSGHTPFGDIFMSRSKDLTYWGKHRHVMSPGYEWWCGLKIGPGSAPIETDEGWLLFFHGAARTCSGYVYSLGGVILDKDNPEIVKYRCSNFLLTPELPYETVGFVPNVLFPCSALCDSETGRIAIYYGCADTVVGLAFTNVDIVVNYIKEYAR